MKCCRESCGRSSMTTAGETPALRRRGARTCNLTLATYFLELFAVAAIIAV